MASIGSSVLPASALLSSPRIINYDLALANTEYDIEIPILAKKVTLQLREPALLKVSQASGNIAAGTYFTLFPGNAYNVESMTGAGALTLYVEASKPSQILEIWYWI